MSFRDPEPSLTRRAYPLFLLLVPVCLLVIANTINIAADLAAMGEALYLVIGGRKHEHALIFAAASVLLQVFVPYRRYAPILKFLTLVLYMWRWSSQLKFLGGRCSSAR